MRIKGGIIETSKQIKIGIEEARRMWQVVSLFDIDGRGNTERLVARNPKLKNLLKDGEYIPSLGQLNLMAHYMDELNKAFAYVSASPLSSTWYRSSTESSPSVAWYVDFSIGSAYYSDKYNSSRVRAVIDF
jgi:hypothetical protein